MAEASVVESWRRLVGRRWLAGASLFVLVLGLGAALVLLSRPVHRAESKLRLGEAPPLGGVTPAGGLFGMLRLGGDAFANDLELLSSRTVAAMVVDEQSLHARLVAPRGWHRDALVESLAATRATQRARFTVEWLRDGSISVRPASGGSSGDVVRTVPGAPASFGGVRAVFVPWREGMPRRITVKTVPYGEAVRVTAERLGVERTRRDANVVRVRYHDSDPGVAQAVVASAVTGFSALRTTIQRRESDETVDSLRALARVTQHELVAAEQALEHVQRTTGLIAPDAQAAATIEQFADAGSRLELVRMELAALDAALRRAAHAGAPADAWSTLLSYPRFLENEMLSSLLQELTTLEQQRRELARRRSADNPEHRAVVEQIDYLDRSLHTVAHDYRAALALQATALEAQLARVSGLLAGVPAQSIDLARRQRDLRVLAEVAILTEQRLRQEQLRQALTFANVQVIDPPLLRDRPIWPRPKLGLVVALLLAGGTALLGMVVVERADSSVRRAADITAAAAVPVLGLVRRFAPAHEAVLHAELAAVVRRAAPAEPCRVRIALAAVDDRASAAAAAAALDAAGRAAAAGGAPPLPQLDVTVLEPVDSFAGGSAAAAAGLPVVLVLHAASSGRMPLARAARLLRDAGAEPAGALLICERRRDAADVWT